MDGRREEKESKQTSSSIRSASSLSVKLSGGSSNTGSRVKRTLHDKYLKKFERKRVCIPDVIDKTPRRRDDDIRAFLELGFLYLEAQPT
jgi:hypothetical protein